MRNQQWRERAACLGRDRSLFFADDDEPRRRDRWDVARTICARCPSRTACLADVMAEEGTRSNSLRFGFRAGLTPSQRWARYAQTGVAA